MYFAIIILYCMKSTYFERFRTCIYLFVCMCVRVCERATLFLFILVTVVVVENLVGRDQMEAEARV
jgi:hypothetical protein